MPASNHSVFTGCMPFLLPNQQRQSTEGFDIVWITKLNCSMQMYVRMSLGWHQQCMWRIASYEVIIMLCTKHSCQSAVDNIWQRLTCYCEIILSSEVREKLQRELRLFLEIFEFCIGLINIPQLLGALSPRPEALDPVEAPPQTLCIGSKSRACYKTYHPEVSKYLFAHIERTCSNRNKLRNKSTSSEILHMKRLVIWKWPLRALKVITIAAIT